MRIIVIAGGAAICGVTAWQCAGNDDSAVEQQAARPTQEAPVRTAWGASPFSSGNAGEVAVAQAALFGRSGRAVDFGGMQVADYIALWGSRARGGDPGAAYKVYQAADLCAGMNDTLPDFTTDAERKDAQAERDRVAQLCKGVSQAQIDERMRFLALAANAGNADAQIDFFMEGPGGKAQDQVADDPALQKWKADALGYLSAAGQHGDAFALGLLANAYDAGNIVEPDAKMSLAYAVANAAARKVNLPLDSLHARFAQLSPTDFDEAVQRGTRMGAACCNQ